ncbi:uncharacterized protein LOC6558482 [Drosophila grimshawi]|uniref:GH16191 n=1 Tax=Drosophila grimshawi TaxID=7222 RepID=B4IX21_DROGR|nr:uncharacterized protein LOC6558482 [Drosophila grimshawi]EDV96327.1 GH16191 [Drosophila grimshawi]
MSSSKCVIVLVLVSCLAALVAARVSVIPESEAGDSPISHLRQRRSPQHGSVVLEARKDRFGSQADLRYNHNLYTSSDGRGSIDAYANANRDFHHNRNNFGGGIEGKWRF